MQRYRLPLVREAPIPSDEEGCLPQPIDYYYLASEVDEVLKRQAELETSRQRYEKLRRLDPHKFHALWLSAAMGTPFDDLVDRLPS